MVNTEVFSNVLGRQTSPSEDDLLSFVSAEGMAKLNSDISRGGNVSETLSEFRKMYDTTQLQRKRAWASLGKEAQQVVNQLRRAPTDVELTYLCEEFSESIKGLLATRLEKGEQLEDVICDLATKYQLHQIHSDAEKLTKVLGVHVAVSRLAPTSRPLKESSSQNSVFFRCGGFAVGPNPAVVWFDFSAVEDHVAQSCSLSTLPASPPPTPSSSRLKKAEHQRRVTFWPLDQVRCLPLETSDRERADPVELPVVNPSPPPSPSARLKAAVSKLVARCTSSLKNR